MTLSMPMSASVFSVRFHVLVHVHVHAHTGLHCLQSNFEGSDIMVRFCSSRISDQMLTYSMVYTRDKIL
jgi:hypothetical protein